ncbi:MAG TPA: rhomboid family intramembrane serine protease [Thermoleophilaceae bacterium]|nr:rhomboid family intramembrane serine protease [Thermoleophilaceae bacterium]
MSESDLFVVCKNCSAEVSPYVTECPYCGQRVRKRAPRIERGEPLEERRSRTALPRLRPGEIPGIAPETRPYATIGVIVVAVLAALVVTTNPLLTNEIGVIGALGNEPWRLFSTPFVHGTSLGYGFVTMLATGIFGMHLERRFGRLAPVAIFLLAGSGGAALAATAGFTPALGANGAALGLLCAWLVDDRRAAARGEDRGNDLIGVAVIAAVLLMLSVAEPDASIAAAVGGALAGALCGLLLTVVRR